MAIFIIIGILLVAAGIATYITTTKKLLLIISLVGLVVTFTGLSIKFVPSGYVGVRTSYGQISDKPVATGFNIHAPFVEAIHCINCKQQEKDYKDLKVWAETAERTEMYCENIVVDYQINSEYAAWIWINVEEWDTNLVKQTSVESGIKAACKQFNDTDVTDRSKIENAAKECVQKTLNDKYGKQIVNIVSVTIGNINFSEAYNQAIEQKAQAKLAAETTEYKNKEEKLKAEAEAEQQRISAEGKANSKKITAEGEAEAIRIKADAEAEANKKLSESLTDELIELKKIEKWNGELPKYDGSGTSIINFSSEEMK